MRLPWHPKEYGLSIKLFHSSFLFLVTILVLIFSGCSTPLIENIQSPTSTNLTTGEGIQKPIPTLDIETPASDTPSPVTATLPEPLNKPESTPTLTKVPSTITPETKKEEIFPGWFVFQRARHFPLRIVFLRTDGEMFLKEMPSIYQLLNFHYSPDGQRIAFEFYPDGTQGGGGDEIYLARPDFSDIKRITWTQGYKGIGSWSPDNQSIVYSQATGGAVEKPGVELYKLDVNTGHVRQITDTIDLVESYPIYSPNGEKIAFTEWHPSEPLDDAHLMVIDPDGNNRKRVLDTPIRYSKIAWSPDGTQLVFSSAEECTDLYLVNENGSGLKQVTDMPGSEFNPVWSPDGEWITFVASTNCAINTNNWKIYIIKSDGNQLTEIENGRNAFFFSPAVFPLPALQAGKSFTITESGDGLNLRQSPALSAEVIKKLKEGEEIQVLEGPVEAEEYLWWRIRLVGSGDEGWVAEIPGWFSGEW